MNNEVSPVHPLIAQRWSPRTFDPDRLVSRKKLLALLEAARWAPSSYNMQPWRFLVFDDTVPDALEAARDCLLSGNAWAREAPVLILGVAEIVSQARKRKNAYAEHDLGLATENLLLQAVAEGLVAHPMAGFDKERASRLFSIPEGFEPRTMVAVGYLLGTEDEAKRQKASRTRLPLETIAFWGKWRFDFED